MSVVALSVALGATAALGWAGSNLLRATSVRAIKRPMLASAWLMIGGFALFSIWAALTGEMALPHAREGMLIACAAVLSALGIACSFQAVGRGAAGIVVPIISANCMVAAAISDPTKLFGDALVMFAALCVVAGCVLAMHRRGMSAETDHSAPLWALASMLCLGGATGLTGIAAQETGAAGTLLWLRLATLALFCVPVLAWHARAGTLAISRRDAAHLAGAAFAGGIGLGAFIVGLGQDAAVTGIIGTQYGALAALAGALWLHERIGPVRWSGAALIALGIALVMHARL